MSATEKRRPYLTLEAVAQTLGVTVPTARTLVRSGDIDGFQVGPRGLWRVAPADLDAYIERQKARALAARRPRGRAAAEHHGAPPLPHS